MHNLSKIEECYQRFILQLPQLLPEGIIEIDLKLLNQMDLLDFHEKEEKDDTLTRYFHVVETKEKITLINDEFIVWIVPNQEPKSRSTCILVSLNRDPMPTLEDAYLAEGVYNTSSLVLHVLEKVLNDIHDTEKIIQFYQEAI